MRQGKACQNLSAAAEEMVAWIAEIVSLGIRRPGYPENLQAEAYIENKFKDFGLENVNREPVPVHRWIPSRTEFRCRDEGESIPCAGIPYTAWTEPDGLEAESVFVGEGSPEDFDQQEVQGKVVVVEARFGELSGGLLKENSLSVFDPDQTIPDGVIHKANWLITNFIAYYQAQLRGAAGFVGLLVDSPIDGCSYYVPYDGFLKDLPAIWIGREHASRVIGSVRDGKTVRLLNVGETKTVDSHNVVGWLPGDPGEETILITSHHDAPFASAVEDASGIAALMALAKEFASRPAPRLRRNLLFVAASGHFHGGIGNRVFIDAHREDWVPDIVAALGVEHIANEVEEDGKGGYRLTGRPEVRAIFTEKNSALFRLINDGVNKWDLDRTIVVPPYLFGPEPPCDSAPFFTAGIPSACLISGPLYLFDEYDTLDKVRRQDLDRVASFYSELITSLDGTSRGELEQGLTRKRDDPPAAPPHWFLPPEVCLEKLKSGAL